MSGRSLPVRIEERPLADQRAVLKLVDAMLDTPAPLQARTTRRQAQGELTAITRLSATGASADTRRRDTDSRTSGASISLLLLVQLKRTASVLQVTGRLSQARSQTGSEAPAVDHKLAPPTRQTRRAG